MTRLFVTLGAVAAAFGVALGAFGAHGLEGRVSADRLATFQTGVRYHMYHALALLFVGWAAAQGWGPVLHWAGYCFVAGILLFSGALYLLVLTDTPWLGAVAPVGGTAFIIGWSLMAWAAVFQGTV